ncbi:glutathione hydrolase 1 proenzyme [Nephila pilipes]|uniref:Glutathione hydrolase 1 proenzyme n=1 Tax=Nephila pilipes TaxID=299642 RepID=A0A8X6NW95_NEPPI|nr:glutathione hydrolase 1 proenzyme [Nephila pilipes]
MVGFLITFASYSIGLLKPPSLAGGLSIAVPGEVAGYHYIHDRFGSLPWKELFPPTIKMCREGIRVNAHLAKVLERKEEYIIQLDGIKKVFVNNETNAVYKMGDIYTRNDLADTLEDIAEEKSNAVYGPSKRATRLLNDLKAAGSIIEESDMRQYSPKNRKPIIKKLRHNMTLYSASTPGGGALLAFILTVLDGYKDFSVGKVLEDTVKSLHRMIETFKYAYARRTELEDSDLEDVKQLLMLLVSDEYADSIRKKIDDKRTYSPNHYGVNVTVHEDYGTSHVSIIAPNGDAVAVTSTINSKFGSMILSPSTGILLNNEMDNFVTPNIVNLQKVPPVRKNHIKPNKRPLSSMSPAIITDSNGNVMLIIGGSGGTQITTSVAQVIMRTLRLGEDIKTAIDAPRFHHQLIPDNLICEENFPNNLLVELSKKGHNLILGSGAVGIIIGIYRAKNGTLYANSDFRKGGAVDGF